MTNESSPTQVPAVVVTPGGTGKTSTWPGDARPAGAWPLTGEDLRPALGADDDGYATIVVNGPPSPANAPSHLQDRPNYAVPDSNEPPASPWDR
jgi:hypothetical protein